METLTAILTRRSVRNFEDREVEPDKIAELISCAVRAPSASNGQPWEFIIVKSQRVKDRIGYLGARSLHERKRKSIRKMQKLFETITQAPVFIVVACDKRKSKLFWQYDGAAATQNMLLAAHSMGLGAVWLGAPIALEKDHNEIKKLLKMPKSFAIASIVALGYPVRTPRPRAAGDILDKVHYERW